MIALGVLAAAAAVVSFAAQFNMIVSARHRKTFCVSVRDVGTSP